MKLYLIIATMLLLQKTVNTKFEFLNANPIDTSTYIFKNNFKESTYFSKSIITIREDKSTESIIPPGSVLIGKQIWQSINLNVSKYRDGSAIPKVTDNHVWATLTTGAYCYYNNDSAAYAKIYGKLYNWHAVNDKRGLCPTGWHVPSKDEWKILETTLGGFALAGGKIKEAGTIHWNKPNAAANNSSGFNAMPAGYRMHKGNFMSTGLYGLWWNSSEENGSSALYNYVINNSGSLNTKSSFKQYGFSIRCVKD